MNKTKIEWTNYSWNPVTGCKHNCYYCYAKRLYGRFGMDFKPQLHEARLCEPSGLKKPSKIFVCSTADLFGEWVPKKWINAVLGIIAKNEQHTFQFLTKNPRRYLEFDFPKNCWLGATIDRPSKMRLNYLKRANGQYKFISFEPLLGDMSELDLKGIDLAIIGLDSTPGAKLPKKEWISSVKHKNIFYKNNIKKLL